MAYDATHPSTFALFRLSNAQLRARGLTAAQIQELRSVQRAAPAARSVEEVKAASVALAEPEAAVPSGPRRVRTEVSGE